MSRLKKAIAFLDELKSKKMEFDSKLSNKEIVTTAIFIAIRDLMFFAAGVWCARHLL
jgi:hypothetical protein